MDGFQQHGSELIISLVSRKIELIEAVKKKITKDILIGILCIIYTLIHLYSKVKYLNADIPPNADIHLKK